MLPIVLPYSGLYSHLQSVLRWPGIVEHATDMDAAMDTLTVALESGDVVLVKASRSAGLERLALSLIKDSTP